MLFISGKKYKNYNINMERRNFKTVYIPK